MYYPKQYHYVQEIQKFNVADYRPRYSHPSHTQMLPSGLTFIVWSNSRKRSVKCDKYKECVSNVATPSPKATKAKCVSFVHMILLKIVGSMVK